MFHCTLRCKSGAAAGASHTLLRAYVHAVGPTCDDKELRLQAYEAACRQAKAGEAKQKARPEAPAASEPPRASASTDGPAVSVGHLTSDPEAYGGVAVKRPTGSATAAATADGEGDDDNNERFSRDVNGGFNFKWLQGRSPADGGHLTAATTARPCRRAGGSGGGGGGAAAFPPPAAVLRSRSAVTGPAGSATASPAAPETRPADDVRGRLAWAVCSAKAGAAGAGSALETYDDWNAWGSAMDLDGLTLTSATHAEGAGAAPPPTPVTDASGELHTRGALLGSRHSLSTAEGLGLPAAFSPRPGTARAPQPTYSPVLEPRASSGASTEGGHEAPVGNALGWADVAAVAQGSGRGYGGGWAAGGDGGGGGGGGHGDALDELLCTLGDAPDPFQWCLGSDKAGCCAQGPGHGLLREAQRTSALLLRSWQGPLRPELYSDGAQSVASDCADEGARGGFSRGRLERDRSPVPIELAQHSSYGAGGRSAAVSAGGGAGGGVGGRGGDGGGYGGGGDGSQGYHWPLPQAGQAWAPAAAIDAIVRPRTAEPAITGLAAGLSLPAALAPDATNAVATRAHAASPLTMAHPVCVSPVDPLTLLRLRPNSLGCFTAGPSYGPGCGACSGGSGGASEGPSAGGSLEAYGPSHGPSLLASAMATAPSTQLPADLIAAFAAGFQAGAISGGAGPPAGAAATLPSTFRTQQASMWACAGAGAFLSAPEGSLMTNIRPSSFPAFQPPALSPAQSRQPAAASGPPLGYPPAVVQGPWGLPTATVRPVSSAVVQQAARAPLPYDDWEPPSLEALMDPHLMQGLAGTPGAGQEGNGDLE
ncbi:hypothetical protein HYH03_011493 [Edaphochlamys debaryana]|uniref:Uncharacterized protein n=1 Tax=Edaphochlamys debaryana TaxID=47281 RepID=A0A835XVX2_9CHLO|nr:hypothetical protein HYH03_011493 [Edaphochlamys debaryana]|eukprot:KAG2490028.1 hypothetical protein HYH03_011493 [Edaphochlamys debaryana]